MDWPLKPRRTTWNRARRCDLTEAVKPRKPPYNAEGDDAIPPHRLRVGAPRPALTTPGITNPADRGFSLAGVGISRATQYLVGALALLLLASVLVARLSPVAFVVLGSALLGTLAAISWRSPRLVLIGIALMPIFDRYLIGAIVPGSLSAITNFFSEGLLLLVALIVTAKAIRDGNLMRAVRHPLFPLVVGFIAVAVVGMVVNDVPLVIAAAGTLFTIDAVALFFLPRLVGFPPRHAAIAAGAFVAVAGIAAVLAIAQITLAPTIFGMEISRGRFSEGNRVTAFFDGNPNMLGAVLAMGVPFPAFAARYLHGRWRVMAWALVFVLAIALFYTFSRGAWLGLAMSMLVVGLIVDWRALALVMAAGLLAYGAAHVMPRNLLVGLLSQPGDEPIPEVSFDLGGALGDRLGTIGSGRDLRFLFIENAAPIIEDHPIVGAGPGRYGGAVSARFNESPLYDQYTDGEVPEGRTVDNFWLHLVVEFGILGSLLFAAMVAYAITELIVAARRAEPLTRVLLASFAAAAVVIAVDSLAEMLLEGNTTSFSTWFFLGIGSALLMAERQRRRRELDPSSEHRAVPQTL